MGNETNIPKTDSPPDIELLQEDFLRNFLRLVQTARIHADSNKLVVELANNFLKVTKELAREHDMITLQLAGGHLYFQSEKIPHLNRNAVVLNQLTDLLHNLDIPGLNFLRKMQEISQETLLSFIRMIIKAANTDNAIEFLVSTCKRKFPWVEIIQQQSDIHDESQDRRDRGIKTYSYALASLKEVTEKIVSQKVVGVRKAIRVVQKMVDSILEDEPVLLGLSTIRDYDDYTHTHSVNVSILSMCLGSRIGLSPQSLEKLGICGLFHDLGKVDIPLEILNKKGKLDYREFDEIKKHSLNSVRQIIKLHASDELKSKVLLPPFEHHLKYNLTGYPQTSRPKPLSLFGRILAIADVYDAISSPRTYRPSALSVDRAIQLMLKGSGTDFDPILLKVFVNMLGPYPVGTLVELNTGQLAFVMSAEEKEKYDRMRPTVVLLDPDGNDGYTKGAKIDLDTKNQTTGEYVYEIARTLNPVVFGLQPAEFVI